MDEPSQMSLILCFFVHISGRTSPGCGYFRSMPDPLRSIDPLGEALHFLRLSGAFYCMSEFTEPWGLEIPKMESFLMLHVVTSGACQVEVPGSPPCSLRSGDIALLPHGAGHRLSSAPGVEMGQLFDLPREAISDRYEILRHGGGGAATTMVCAVVRFDHPAAQRLVKLLPAFISVDSWRTPETEWLQSTLRFLASEARELRAGGDTVITRLADILVIQALRSWIANAPLERTSWLGALRDKQIGRAISLIHRDPAKRWSVASLAAEVGMSRSAFAARFTTLVGEPAMRYATRWNMHAAETWLKEEKLTLGAAANRLGYDSEAAFSRAFKRIVGVAPGAIRKSATLGQPAVAAMDGPVSGGRGASMQI